MGASARRDATRLQSRSRCAGLFGVCDNSDKHPPSFRSASRLTSAPLCPRLECSGLHFPVSFLASMCRLAQTLLSYKCYAMSVLTINRRSSSRSPPPKR